MGKLTILAAGAVLLWGILAEPGLAQVVTPGIFPAPCTGSHCLNEARGAKVFTGGPAPAVCGCPAGTVFNPKRGTCRVMPASATP